MNCVDILKKWSLCYNMIGISIDRKKKYSLRPKIIVHGQKNT